MREWGFREHWARTFCNEPSTMLGSPMRPVRPPKKVERDAKLSSPLKASLRNLSVSSSALAALCSRSRTASRAVHNRTTGPGTVPNYTTTTVPGTVPNGTT